MLLGADRAMGHEGDRAHGEIAGGSEGCPRQYPDAGVLALLPGFFAVIPSELDLFAVRLLPITMARFVGDDDLRSTRRGSVPEARRTTLVQRMIPDAGRRNSFHGDNCMGAGTGCAPTGSITALDV